MKTNNFEINRELLRDWINRNGMDELMRRTRISDSTARKLISDSSDYRPGPQVRLLISLATGYEEAVLFTPCDSNAA